VTTAALRFDFFAAEAVRSGSFCRPDFSSVERLPSLGIARLPRILFFLRSGFHGEVFISKPPRLNFSVNFVAVLIFSAHAMFQVQVEAGLLLIYWIKKLKVF
jgi:hypothetical protein